MSISGAEGLILNCGRAQAGKPVQYIQARELYSCILLTQPEPLEIGVPHKDMLNFTPPQLSGKINQFVMQFYTHEVNFRL